jgi:hypothetical protein
VIRRLLLPIVAHLLVLPFTLARLAFDAFTDPDHHRRANAALVLIAAVMVIGWACGVFEE